jgi:hypothetical protein
MPYLPNPIAFGAVRAGAYAVVGVAIRTRARRRGNPFAFGVARAILGLVVGAPVVILVGLVLPEGSRDLPWFAVLALPRLVLSAVLIRRWFDPTGGWREVLAWALASVLVSSLMDVLLTHLVDDRGLFRMWFC